MGQEGKSPDTITESEANLVNNFRKPPAKPPIPGTNTMPPDPTTKTKPPDPTTKLKPHDSKPPGRSHNEDTSAEKDNDMTDPDGQESENCEYDYFQSANDPDLTEKGARAVAKREHIRAIRRYSDETLPALIRKDIKGESLFLDYMTAFRPHSIRTWEEGYINLLY